MHVNHLPIYILQTNEKYIYNSFFFDMPLVIDWARSDHDWASAIPLTHLHTGALIAANGTQCGKVMRHDGWVKSFKGSWAS